MKLGPLARLEIKLRKERLKRAADLRAKEAAERKAYLAKEAKRLAAQCEGCHGNGEIYVGGTLCSESYRCERCGGTGKKVVDSPCLS